VYRGVERLKETVYALAGMSLQVNCTISQVFAMTSVIMSCHNIGRGYLVANTSNFYANMKFPTLKAKQI